MRLTLGTAYIVGLSLVLWPWLATPAAAQSAIQAPPKNTLAAPPLPPLPHPTLDRIHRANALACGVSKEEEDYSRDEDHGNRAAFDIDLCKAVAVATLGAGAHLVVKSFPDEAFALRALRSGEVDLVATASLTARNMGGALAFSAPVLLDGQGTLLPRSATGHTAADLAGKRVCFLTGSAAEQGLHTYAEAHHLAYIWYPFSEAGEMEAAFFTGNCDAITGDVTQLANIRSIDPRRAAEFEVLPEVFRPDPLAVATWAGDAQFAAITYWTVEVLLNAEALGVTQSNVATLQASPSPELQALLGQPFGATAALGLPPRWATAVLQAVGNYGELFDRDLGAHSALQLDRGRNRPDGLGGALYTAPLHDR